MLRQVALLGAVAALVSGCAHSTYDNRVVVSDRGSPYVTTDTYGTTYGYPYGTYGATEYDNTSKGHGARTMMQNPWAERTYGGTYSAPGGVAAGTSKYGSSYPSDDRTYNSFEYDNTSRGAGARAMMQNPYAEKTYTYSPYYTAPAGAAGSTGETDTGTTSKGAGARSLSSNPDQ